MLGGDINVTSKLGNGSTFYFTCIHVEKEQFEKNLSKNSEILKNKYVLVVDDNEDSRILISDMLFEWKMFPIICASSREALKLISADRYDFEIGLIDISMTHIDGVQLADKIKDVKPLFPLIALSSVSGFVNTSNFEAKLNKPINKLQIFNIVHKIITNNLKDSAYIGDNYTSTKKISELSSHVSKFDKNVKILIAEDILYNQTLLHNMLETLGYHNIDVASNGRETIDKIDTGYKQQNQFIILLLDLRMPVMDGYDVIDHIKNKGYPLPKIVAVTASVLNEDRDRCKKKGVQYFINKPIDMAQLKNVLLKLSKI
jgi:two-component system sensor histidine kinase/response regulator